jgi:NAD(P)-dependent dehydrogenase (short-subunit alcohol dehydrogenase family)
MDLALKDRRVLITGGSQGLGKAIARGFLAEGARVVIVSRDQERLQKRWSSSRHSDRWRERPLISRSAVPQRPLPMRTGMSMSW